MKRTSALFLVLASLPPATVAQEAGMTIVGERDSAVGLYLTPWQDEAASDVDRPPGAFDPGLEPLDAGRFARQVHYEEAIRAYRRERLFRSR